MLLTNPTIDKITSYVSQMSEDEQKTILMAFEKKELQDKAMRLNKSINKKMKITTMEIVAEINKIRKEHADKRNSI
jgi:hypothetical protein